MKRNLKTRNKKGFTLAEVLVTLAIIGIVAALTVPTLIQSIQKSQYESALKKSYSVIAQAYKSLQADGTDMTAAFPGTDSGAAALNILAPKLNLIKNCGSGMGCWYDSQLFYFNGNINMTNVDTDWGANNGRAILADGTMFAIVDYGSKCANTAGTGPLLNSTCGVIAIDVNGAKMPNIVGRDYFQFWITKTGIYPNGSNGDAYISHCDPNNAFSLGFGCAARVLTSGMNY